MKLALLMALVAYHFEVPVSKHLIEALEAETAAILEDSGMRLEWWDKGSAEPMPRASDIFVVTFHGQCSPTRVLLPGRSALGITHVSDGEVLPFSDVDCDQVRATMVAGMRRGDPVAREVAFGRALARVAVHELVHIVTKSRLHGHRGVAQPAFTSYDLNADQFTLAPEDVERIRVSSHAIAAPAAHDSGDRGAALE